MVLAGMLSHSALALLCSHPSVGSLLPPSNRKQRGWARVNRQKEILLHDCVPPAPQLARQDTVGLYLACFRVLQYRHIFPRGWG